MRWKVCRCGKDIQQCGYVQYGLIQWIKMISLFRNLLVICAVWWTVLIPNGSGAGAGVGASGQHLHLWPVPGQGPHMKCPHECSCSELATTIDCSKRRLKRIPAPFPPHLEKLDLQGNNITFVSRDDFRGLRHLKILQLQENQVYSIERGAFDDLVLLERLRLNKNHLRSLPDLLLTKLSQLSRLDVSDNGLQFIGGQFFEGVPRLRNLQVDNNQLRCLDADAVRGLKELQIFTLNYNNLTMLAKDVFSEMRNLRILRISENRLICDCNLQWLAIWLRRNPRLALFTKCAAPPHLRNRNIAELESRELKCPNVHGTHSVQGQAGHFALPSRSPDVVCSDVKPNCPESCWCTEDDLVDCRQRGLKRIPPDIPTAVTELHVEENNMSSIPSMAFATFKYLKIINMSSNGIIDIAPDAFAGLLSLTSLILTDNRIHELIPGLFRGLRSLQLLLLNSNKITCLQVDIFADLANLNLLSLYDNKLISMANGTFTSLRNLQTLHLVRNPFVCDCNLKWLKEFLQSNPLLDQTSPRCEGGPGRLDRHRIDRVPVEKFKCKETEYAKTEPYASGSCMLVAGDSEKSQCPHQCACHGTIVNCSSRKLEEIPKYLPKFTTQLLLNDNRITRLERTWIFKMTPHLSRIDLSNNMISWIAENAFQGANSLVELNLASNDLRHLNASMLSGHLDSLRSLSFYDNQIACISSGTFDMLPQLLTLNLLNNPLHCNCHLGWFPEWMHQKGKESAFQLIGRPRCAMPAYLKDTPVQDIVGKELKCSMDEDACAWGYQNDQSFLCPDKCTCTATIVRCSRQKLKKFPPGIPSTTTELYLDVNEILEIPEEINQLRELVRLDLSNNLVAYIPDYAFANLTKLATLIMSYNKLQCIPRHSFRGLTALRLLSLHGNDISTMPEGTFDDLLTMSHIALGSNPFHCDCELRWLSELFKKSYIEPGIATCATPNDLRDKLVLSASSDRFVCTQNQRAPESVLVKCDTCHTYPCKNGAVCSKRGVLDYECRCVPGYHGKNCEHEIDACYGNPCVNGGSCKVVDHGRFSCVCPLGYEGDRCETNIDDCVGNLCQNNASCDDHVQAYSCACLKGYTGSYCDKKIEYCSSSVNPCKNGATCIDRLTDYACACPPGYRGRNCTENINDCQLSLCQNSATCVDGISNYTCKCPDGYQGRYCESAPMVSMLMYPQTSPCEASDCKNGLCYQPAVNAGEYSCKCHPGFTGKYCQAFVGVSLTDVDSYIQLNKFPVKAQVNLTFTMATKEQFGVVFYYGQSVKNSRMLSAHLSMELFRGRLKVSFDVGNYPVSTLFSYELLDDGEFHRLEFIIKGKNLTMKVDQNKSRYVINEGPRDYLPSDGRTYFGGLEGSVKSEAIRQWQLRNATSLRGCVSEVRINNDLVDLGQVMHQHKVTSGCASYAKNEDHVCLKDPKRCLHGGKCHVLDLLTYQCQCPVGYAGLHCDQEPSCEKRARREYLQDEKGCRSRKPVKISECAGLCHPQANTPACCRPTKIKQRRIKMQCPLTGKTYYKHYEVVRKCSCSQQC